MALSSDDPRFSAALQEAFRCYHETHTVCRADGCKWGYAEVVPTQIDPWTQEPRRGPCGACDGVGFVHIQQELPL